MYIFFSCCQCLKTYASENRAKLELQGLRFNRWLTTYSWTIPLNVTRHQPHSFLFIDSLSGKPWKGDVSAEGWAVFNAKMNDCAVNIQLLKAVRGLWPRLLLEFCSPCRSGERVTGSISGDSTRGLPPHLHSWSFTWLLHLCFSEDRYVSLISLHIF